ncbi:hypothetical protein ACN38_g12581 [Penicillium nordicum]|uniref:Uncharacterized protein n=1 Tax=Penicillium nordicum TaxID=229535 RepID=A0A0M8NPD9_9EURO|nr:hypothetical protein ACN38_g12581 [Penicillium nordicum]
MDPDAEVVGHTDAAWIIALHREQPAMVMEAVREAQSNQTFDHQLRFNSYPNHTDIRLHRSQLAREVLKNQATLT